MSTGWGGQKEGLSQVGSWQNTHSAGMWKSLVVGHLQRLGRAGAGRYIKHHGLQLREA